MSETSLPENIEFNLPQKYRVIKNLGEGACGQTFQIRDEDIDSNFVVKKYSPVIAKEIEPELYDELLHRFRDEARILFRINHPNIVRIFNFFDYQQSDTAYIIMEMISGSDILDYTSRHPVELPSIFEKTIDGFSHLESQGILHRDIRPHNLLIANSGEPKIIDFGFGKEILLDEQNDDKSISINWWCEVPPEFADKKYDFQTEVYFVGKLFERAIIECDLSEFKYRDVVAQMCRRDRKERLKSFASVKEQLIEGKFQELKFEYIEIQAYRKFSDSLFNLITQIEGGSDYNKNTSEVIKNLEELHRNTMLESDLPEPVKLARIFVSGGFRYRTSFEFSVQLLKDFIKVVKGQSKEKRSIIFANLHSKLDAIDRNWPESGLDDEIPF